MRAFAGDSVAWDDLILGLGTGHLLQSSDWGALKSRWGWSVHRLTWSDGAGAAWGAAQVLTRRVSPTPFVVGYASKGPLLTDPRDAGRWSVVLSDLADWSRRRGLTHIKIDPDVPADATDVTAAWSAAGWCRSEAPVQFPNTMRTDLTAGEPGLLSGMHQKARYNIRLAGRRGVTARHAGADGMDAFYDLYLATGRRTGFGLRTWAYYIDAWSTLLSVGRATVILAEREGRPLAGVIPVVFGDTAWYLYGASADEGREHMAAYLAQWESIRWAIRRGCRCYDWWGGPTDLVPADPLWGVYRFKLAFGAVWAPQVGAWDLPVRPWRWRAYRALDRLRRGLLAPRRTAAPPPS
jgi:peptidoglycan pentaglycine glycine transferase (the first glycine)